MYFIKWHAESLKACFYHFWGSCKLWGYLGDL